MKKRVTLHLEFEITIDEDALPPQRSEIGDEQEEFYNQIQKRLFDALLSHPDAYGSYQRYLLTACLECTGSRDWYDLLLSGIQEYQELEDILSPAIATMSKPDQEYFEEAKKEQLFYESAEGFHECFTAKITNATIVENKDFVA